MRSDHSPEIKCDRSTDSSTETIDLTDLIEAIDLAEKVEMIELAEVTEMIAVQQMSGGEKQVM